jgi:hypothetical protein
MSEIDMADFDMKWDTFMSRSNGVDVGPTLNVNHESNLIACREKIHPVIEDEVKEEIKVEVNIFIYIYVYVDVCICVCVYVHKCIFIYKHVYICVYMYICIYIYIYIYRVRKRLKLFLR